MAHQDDSAAIRAAQARYAEGGKADDLAEIYLAARRMAARMIARQVQAKGFVLAEERKEEKAHNAAAYIVTQFLERPGFALKSPAAYVYLRVLHELYYRRKADAIIEFRDAADIARIMDKREASE